MKTVSLIDEKIISKENIEEIEDLKYYLLAKYGDAEKSEYLKFIQKMDKSEYKKLTDLFFELMESKYGIHYFESMFIKTIHYPLNLSYEYTLNSNELYSILEKYNIIDYSINLSIVQLLRETLSVDGHLAFYNLINFLHGIIVKNTETYTQMSKTWLINDVFTDMNSLNLIEGEESQVIKIRTDVINTVSDLKEELIERREELITSLITNDKEFSKFKKEFSEEDFLYLLLSFNKTRFDYE